METLIKVICVLCLWTFLFMGSGQLQEDSDIDCTLNCTCCKKQECAKGNWYDDECTHGCIDGYRGARCYIKCKHDCKQCLNSDDKCTECEIGRYGFDCTKNCSVGCAKKSCPISDGKCKCRDNFWGDLCDKCNRGKYGALCENQCPVGCKGYLCDKTSGNCSDGCFLDSLIDAKCDRCINGYYGEMCHRQCSTGCKNGTCKKETGDCLLGCIDGFNGSNCDHCMIGKPEWSCTRDLDVNNNSRQASDSASPPIVTVAVLCSFLAALAVSNIVLVGRLYLGRRAAFNRKSQSVRETLVDAVYENTKNDHVNTDTGTSVYTDLEQKQGGPEHSYSSVLCPTESITSYENIQKKM